LSQLADLKELSPRRLKDAANWSTRRWGMLTVSGRPSPDFLIVGTKRGGTTSLFNYLLMHPGILGLYPQLRGRKSTDYFFKNYERGADWYRSHFHTRAYRNRVASRLGYQPVSGEASPYYMWDPRIAARVRAQSPQVKAIALLRDPVERAWSHYQERVQNGVEPLPFTEALAAESRRTGDELATMERDPRYHSDAHDWYSYRARGVYLPQLENWLSVFPREQLLVLRSEDMYSDVQQVFDEVCGFLGIPTVPLPTKKTFNASARAPMPDDARDDLSSFYRPHNERLAAYLGWDSAWS
jgi:hypothetical protein